MTGGATDPPGGVPGEQRDPDPPLHRPPEQARDEAELAGGSWTAPPEPLAGWSQGPPAGAPGAPASGSAAEGGFTPWPAPGFWNVSDPGVGGPGPEPGPPYRGAQGGGRVPPFPPFYGPAYGQGYPFPPPPRPPQRRELPVVMAVVAVALVVLLVVGRIATSSTSLATGDAPGAGAPADAASIAQCIDPAVVNIFTTLGFQAEQAAGTGIVLTPTGEVLTNNHVIDGATQIDAVDIGNGQTYSATVVGYDRTDDVALLQLDGASGLPVARLGDSSAAVVGTPVVAVGNARGAGGTPSYAGGAVTALDQSITATDDIDHTSENLNGLIQVNADIQPGDSGGPLVGSDCRVIGMDTAASTGYQLSARAASGFAIPINLAVAIGRDIATGRPGNLIHVGATAFLGVMVQTANNGPGGVSGAEVVGVQPGEPADQAGLAVGDVITSVQGATIRSASALTTAVQQLAPGQVVSIGWTTAPGLPQSATVRLAAGPAG